MTPPDQGELTLDNVLGDLQTIAKVVIDEEDQGTASYQTVQQRLGELSLHVLTYIRFLETNGYVNYDRGNDRITITDLGRAASQEPDVWREEAEAEFMYDETGVHRIGEPSSASLDADVADVLDGIADFDLDGALDEISSSDTATNRIGGSRIGGGPPPAPAEGTDDATNPEMDAIPQTPDGPEPDVPEPDVPEPDVPETVEPPEPAPQTKPDPPPTSEKPEPPASQTASTTNRASNTAGKSMSNDSFSSRRLSTQSPAASRGASAGSSASNLFDRGEEIGSGGIGTVFRGTQVKLGRDVAIKEIKEIFDVFAGVQRSDIVARFTEIVQTQAQLLHPNIIQIVDIDTDAEFPFVVMQYAPNGNLRRLIDMDDRPPLQTAMKYFLQVLHALNTAHENGVTHGGIKPENVVLDHAGNALVTDFGMSGVAELDANRGASQVYVGVGTVAYMSPEQFRDPNTSSVKSDLYSLGIMFYEMLTGKVPGRRSPMPSSFYPDIPRALDDVFDRMSMDDADERYESIDEVLADIYASEDVMEIIDKRGGFLFLRDPMSSADGTGIAVGGAGALDDSDDEESLAEDSSDVEELAEDSSDISEVSDAEDDDSDAEDADGDEEEDGDVLSKLDKYGEMFDDEDSDAEDSDAEEDEDEDEDEEDSDSDED